MNKIKNSFTLRLLTSLVLISALSVFAGCNQAAKKPQTTPAKPQVLAFYEKGWNDLTYGFPSLQRHYQDISVLMPYWYTMTSDGNIKESTVGMESEVVNFMRQHPEIKVLPLVNKDLKDQSVLSDQATRTRAVNNIVKTVVDNNFDGINIDFELLPAKIRDDLTAFIRELSQQLHSQNKMDLYR